MVTNEKYELDLKKMRDRSRFFLATLALCFSVTAIVGTYLIVFVSNVAAYATLFFFTILPGILVCAYVFRLVWIENSARKNTREISFRALRLFKKKKWI